MSKQHVLTAIIYDRKGRPISIGQNSYTKTHPLMAKISKTTGQPNRIFLHAEVAALVKLKDWRRAYKLVVSRYNSFGEPVMARPCTSCQHLIKLAGINYVEHT